ncbi:hypothetical protein B0H17DRAFT_1134802 [Mycena rosella]|uniref:Uncharacterized protein n=1 Tax=Mycena rosella TaxID=1033263 RepID=A0AAD7GIL3_MYCRO|nr:hypothetical protein B0H17DRAFT_1134802 [Mycena rosella]
MELVPSTVLKSEYAVLQTTIYQQYQPELAADPALETSLWSVAGDLFKSFNAFLVNNRTSIIAELQGADRLSDGMLETLVQLDLFAPSGQQGHAPNEINDRNNALAVMSGAQAYLERICWTATFPSSPHSLAVASKRFADVVAKFIDHSFLGQLNIGVRKKLLALPANASPALCLELIQYPVEKRRVIAERRNHLVDVGNTLADARRDLERDAPDLPGRAGTQHTAADSRIRPGVPRS